jgi:hypothetical protein
MINVTATIAALDRNCANLMSHLAPLHAANAQRNIWQRQSHCALRIR